MDLTLDLNVNNVIVTTCSTAKQYDKVETAIYGLSNLSADISFSVKDIKILSTDEDSGQNEFRVQSMQNCMLIPNITIKTLKNASESQKTSSKLQKSYPSWPNFSRKQCKN
ncbi:hypothetical protein B9Z55_012128 [Caenorhabditis nigoni]|uniref:Uncharacterized protein n=1 Tax=Caenorhabditis nigoni TaxID=1611254 RepID=A0A2G5TVZ0_9PELO|nr:hypothetical protein B9Z55_012128 [Caenorhabditis nigoni]